MINLEDRLRRRQVGPVQRTVGNALHALAGHPVQDNQDDLATKIALLEYEHQLKQDPLDDQLKQARIAALVRTKPPVNPHVEAMKIKDMQSRIRARNTPKPPQTVTTETQVPFSDISAAGNVLAKSPKDWQEAGMATKTPGTGLFGTGVGPSWGWGSKPDVMTPNSDAEAMIERARNVIANPIRKSTRTSNYVPFQGESEPVEMTPESTYDPAAEFEDLINKGYSEDEAYAILAQKGA